MKRKSLPRKWRRGPGLWNAACTGLPACPCLLGCRSLRLLGLSLHCATLTPQHCTHHALLAPQAEKREERRRRGNMDTQTSDVRFDEQFSFAHKLYGQAAVPWWVLGLVLGAVPICDAGRLGWGGRHCTGRRLGCEGQQAPLWMTCWHHIPAGLVHAHACIQGVQASW